MAYINNEFYLVMKKNKIVKFFRKWMELENIVLTHVTQSKTDRYQVLFHMWIPGLKYLFHFNTYFHFYLFICVCTSVWVCISAGTHRDSMTVSDLRELESRQLWAAPRTGNWTQILSESRSTLSHESSLQLPPGSNFCIYTGMSVCRRHDTKWGP